LTFTVYTPLGCLGYGFPISSMKEALKNYPDIDVIAMDAGSTDPGPYYLGVGKSYTNYAMVKRDLKLCYEAAREIDVPLLIGTSGGSGAKEHTDWLLGIFKEIVDETGFSSYVAVIYADVCRELLVEGIKAGRVEPFESEKVLTPEEVERSTNIVAQMGVQPFISALNQGANVIIGGRAFDAAVIAAYPIWKGADPGLAYHMGKILECGSAVALPRESDGLIGILEDDYFEVIPADPNKVCLTDIVAAHTLYERSTPYFHEFPGGCLDLSHCIFEQATRRSVCVRGSKYIENPRKRLKVEGAALVGYRNICIAGIRDPYVIVHMPDIEEKVISKVKRDLPQLIHDVDYHVCFHTYGTGEVMLTEDPDTHSPLEIGLIIDVVAKKQSIADTVGALIRSAVLHMGFEGRRCNSGNVAFMFTPAEFAAPPCYEFNIYHLWEVDDLEKPFEIMFTKIGGK
jgi:hypothetical protein